MNQPSYSDLQDAAMKAGLEVSDLPEGKFKFSVSDPVTGAMVAMGNEVPPLFWICVGFRALLLNPRPIENARDFAIQQLTGFHYGQEYGLIGLIESMGLTAEEWISIRGEVSWLNSGNIEALDRHFEQGGDSNHA